MFLVIWFLASLTSSLVLWSLVLWFSSSLVLQFSSCVVFCFSGSLVLWFYPSVVIWFCGSMVPWKYRNASLIEEPNNIISMMNRLSTRKGEISRQN